MNGATTRCPFAARRGITRSQVCGVSGNPWSSSTSGPAPRSKYAKRRPLASMLRVVSPMVAAGYVGAALRVVERGRGALDRDGARGAGRREQAGMATLQERERDESDEDGEPEGGE